jgi:hypothetical protein
LVLPEEKTNFDKKVSITVSSLRYLKNLAVSSFQRKFSISPIFHHFAAFNAQCLALHEERCAMYDAVNDDTVTES